MDCKDNRVGAATLVVGAVTLVLVISDRLGRRSFPWSFAHYSLSRP
ncbi:hypothetical protein COLSTE_01948 [Collinsella stercoris DSM 13279]|uniref:Uncharacterized protein n=1 Tax=Collinsella stercoris DSM 13279 TaxID=445975 RepID=B6GCX0_9ACTN|nr:hypothetical protein COLSTE_01948 [Collinsella stercoris DSM 13279]